MVSCCLFTPYDTPTILSSIWRSTQSLVEPATELSSHTVGTPYQNDHDGDIQGCYLTVVGGGIRSVRSRREILNPNCPWKSGYSDISYMSPRSQGVVGVKKLFHVFRFLPSFTEVGRFFCLNHAIYICSMGAHYRFRRCYALYSVSKSASHCRPRIRSTSGNFQPGLPLLSLVK